MREQFAVPVPSFLLRVQLINELQIVLLIYRIVVWDVLPLEIDLVVLLLLLIQ